MDKPGCNCSDDSGLACLTCGDETEPEYWCETCQQMVADKRCPGCGLKARKVREPLHIPKPGRV